MTQLEIAKLSAQEKLDLIGEIWDSLTPRDVTSTPAQDAEIARRLATFDEDAKRALTWEAVEAELDRGTR